MCRGLGNGMSRMLERQITQKDIALFSEVSGDRNPVHLDPKSMLSKQFLVKE